MQTWEIKTEPRLAAGWVQGRAGAAELNYSSQFNIKDSDQILRRTLSENCHIHSDADPGQDTLSADTKISMDPFWYQNVKKIQN